MMDYGSLPEWLSAFGSTGAVIAALVVARGESRRATRADALLAGKASAQAALAQEHFVGIVHDAYTIAGQTLSTFSVEQDDAAYYAQYDLFRVAVRSTASQLQRLTAFPGLPLNLYLASDHLVELLNSRQLTEPLDGSVIIAIENLRTELSRIRSEASA